MSGKGSFIAQETESTKAQSECLEASDKKELRMKRWREGESITQSCADHAEGFCCYLE